MLLRKPVKPPRNARPNSNSCNESGITHRRCVLIFICTAAAWLPFRFLDLQNANWAAFDKPRVRFILWAMSASMGIGVALVGYLFQSNKLSCIISVSVFLLLASFKNTEVPATLGACLAIGSCLSAVFNRFPSNTRQAYRTRITIVVSAILVIALIGFDMADDGERALTCLVCGLFAFIHSRYALTKLDAESKKVAAI